MARHRRIKLDRGDTLGGTAPLILLTKGGETLSEHREFKRRSLRGGRAEGAGILKLFVNVFLVLLFAAIVLMLLGQGHVFDVL